jgi:NUMOD3 motif
VISVNLLHPTLSNMTFKNHVPWSNGKTHSEESKKKISESLKGRIPWNKGKHTGLIPWNKIRTYSEESRRKMREHSARYWLGKKFTLKHRRNMSLARKGLPSPLKGRKLTYICTQEHRRHLSIANTGKHHSLETLKKMSESQKGKHWSIEARKKLSIALKKLWQQRRRKKKHGSKT